MAFVWSVYSSEDMNNNIVSVLKYSNYVQVISSVFGCVKFIPQFDIV